MAAPGAAATDILVIQLTRLGDYCQTIPLLRELRLQLAGSDQPGHLVLVCDSETAPAVAEYIDTVIALPLRRLRQRSEVDLGTHLSELNQLLSPLRQQKWLSVYNLNINPLAGLIADMAVTSDRHGWSSGETPTAGSSSRLVNCLWSITGQRAHNNLLLADLYRKQAGRSDLSAPTPNRRQHGIAVVHPGAGSASRRLSLQFWAELAKTLIRDPSVDEVRLTGNVQEATACNRIARMAGPGISSVAGQTDIGDLRALLQEALLLVAVDTGVLHLGAVMGTPLLGIYPGAAGWGETGPYQEGALCVSPERDCYPCREGAPTCANWDCFNDFEGVRLAAIALELISGNAETIHPLARECRRSGLQLIRQEMVAGWLTGSDVASEASTLTMPGALLRTLYDCSDQPWLTWLQHNDSRLTAELRRLMQRLQQGLTEGINELQRGVSSERLAALPLLLTHDSHPEWIAVTRFLYNEIAGAGNQASVLQRLNSYRELLQLVRKSTCVENIPLPQITALEPV